MPRLVMPPVQLNDKASKLISPGTRALTVCLILFSAQSVDSRLGRKNSPKSTTSDKPANEYQMIDFFFRNRSRAIIGLN